MSALTKVGTPSLASLLPPANNKICDVLAGEALGAFDACYIKGSDGKVYKSTGAAATAPAVVDGYAAKAYASGAPVTLFFDVEVQYATGMTPGTNFFLSGTTAGGLDTATSTGGTRPCARAKTATVLLLRRVWEVG